MRWLLVLFPVWLCYRFPLFLQGIGSIAPRLLSVLFILTYWRTLLKKRIWDMGFPLRWRKIMRGCCCGAICVAAVIFLFVMSKVLVIKDYTLYVDNMIKGLAYFFLIALEEELVFRGFVMGGLADKKPWARLLFSAFIFAWAHGNNPNIHWLSYFNIFLAGVVMGFFYLIEKNISYSLGFHWAWNFFQGCIFGLPVSGYLYPGFIRLQGQAFAKDIHAFGIEGELFCTLVLGIVVLFLYRKHLLPSDKKGA